MLLSSGLLSGHLSYLNAQVNPVANILFVKTQREWTVPQRKGPEFDWSIRLSAEGLASR